MRAVSGGRAETLQSILRSSAKVSSAAIVASRFRHGFTLIQGEVIDELAKMAGVARTLSESPKRHARELGFDESSPAVSRFLKDSG